MLSKVSRADLVRLIALADAVRTSMSDGEADALVIHHGTESDLDALRVAVEGLDPDARAELLVLTWLGRGDFVTTSADEIQLAQARIGDRAVAYMIGMSAALSHYWKKALEMTARS